MTAEKMYSINFTENVNKFCFNLQNNGVNSYLFINGTEVFKLKAGKWKGKFKGKYYPQDFLDESLHEVKMHQMSVILIGILQITILSMNHIFAMVVII